MNNLSSTTNPVSPIPPDDRQRNLTLAAPDKNGSLPHLGIVGDTYTILLTGNDTNGRFCLIDMHVPPGGGQRASFLYEHFPETGPVALHLFTRRAGRIFSHGWGSASYPHHATTQARRCR